MIYFKKRKIVVDIITIFLFLFISTLSIIITYTYIKNKNVFLLFASELIKREHQTTIEKLNQLLSPTPFIQTTSHLVQNGSLSIADIKSLTAFMYMMLESYPEFLAVYLADTQGNIFFECRYSDELAKKGPIGIITFTSAPRDTKFVSEIISAMPTQPRVTIVYKNKHGEILKKEQVNSLYNPLIRPWYIGAANNIDQRWMGIYAFFGTNEKGLSVSYAIKQHDELRGVLAADLNLMAITKHLDEISNKNKSIFILTNDKQLLASEKVLTSEDKSHPEPLYDIEKIKNPIIMAAYKKHERDQKNNFVFKVKNIEYIASFTPFSINPENKWEIVSIIPIDFFIGPLKLVNQNNLIFSAIIVLLGLILVIICSRNISRPIMRLAREAKKLTKLHFGGHINIPTHTYEVIVMQDAINKAKTAISSFAKYIPRALVEQLLEKNMVAELGGQKKQLTILFTDIARFTMIAEDMDPKDLMLHLSDYLDRLTRVIHQNKGNVDKYIGDAIMAFWGAPIDNPNHAIDACHAMLACHKAVLEMNQYFKETGKPILITRFGLATGEVIVGNVGSTDRLNYTVLGDTVNSAARLQAINKNYGTHMIVSESIFEQCSHTFLFRPIDSVHLRGKKQEQIIYELMADLIPHSPFYATKEQMERSELQTKAFNAFRKGQVQTAFELYLKMHQQYPDDPIAHFYIKRCEEH